MSTFNSSFPTGAENGTIPNVSFFAGGMIDTILTTTGHVSPLAYFVVFFDKLLGAPLGPDPSLLLAVLGFIWGVFKIGSQVYGYIVRFIDDYLMCSMDVSEHDDIHPQLMKWLSCQPGIKKHRNLMAQTEWKSAWDEGGELEDDLSWTDVGEIDGENRMYLNFANQTARAILRYVPAMGATTAFWHKGTYFWLHRKKESLVNSHSKGGAMKDSEETRISCFGRSTDPIKQLLADAKALHYNDARQKTTIHRPRAKEQRRDYNMWQQIARRPVRPIRTVVLDPDNKHQVLKDMNKYLHPRTSEWYAARGIPLRRGYLFHGPPGTGKTSFSFALAGVFGIDIYVISLQDASINEEDLASLLINLPQRCIVLLEDIDTAGLRRDLSEKRASKKKNARNSNPVAVDGISLSGLLNAIDGVASHEGRILIMTTNQPEALDEALIRPGRVDVQVEFKNASSAQAAELFLRMYEATPDAEELEGVTPEKLKTISEEFGRRVQGGSFSAADLQEFILGRRESPLRALDEVQEWMDSKDSTV